MNKDRTKLEALAKSAKVMVYNKLGPSKVALNWDLFLGKIINTNE